MTSVKVKNVFLKNGYVHVKLDNNENYDKIYRAAKGVYWDEETSSLFFKGAVTQEDALYFISEAMKNEYYINLILDIF